MTLLWALVGLGPAALLVALTCRYPRLRRANFRGATIPSGAGIAVVFGSMLALKAAAVKPAPASSEATSVLVALVCFGCLGLTDDLLGDRTTKGIRGHLRSLRAGRLTTGLLKAIGGLAAGYGIGLMILNQGWLLASLTSLLIAMSANAVNLVDTRPGRAVGAYAATVVLFSLHAAWSDASPPTALLVVLVPAACIGALDSAGLVMLGDAGSNALGAAIGAFVCARGGPGLLGFALAVLVIVHYAGERVSLSAVIERTPVLRYLDRLTGIR